MTWATRRSAAELDRWGEWYLGETGVDGLRLDAVKHIRFTFFTHWLEALREKTGKELWAVGEYWSPGGAARPDALPGQLRQNHVPV